MSVQTEITRLENAKTAIVNAIAGKGVEVPDGTMLDGLAALIEGIEAGGADSDYLPGYDVASGMFIPATKIYTTLIDTGWGNGPGEGKAHCIAVVGWQLKGASNQYRNILKVDLFNANINETINDLHMYACANPTDSNISWGSAKNHCEFNSDGTIKLVGYTASWPFAVGHVYTWIAVKER